MSKPSLWKTVFLLCVFCAVEAIASPAQTFTTLLNLDGTNGANPTAGLVQGLDGNFYGTTFYGGAYTSCDAGLGCGTVFKITAGGKLTTLHSFDGTDGSHPAAGLVLATNGNFYGTTSAGGANGDGTVFQITPAGKLTTLRSFGGTDGAHPYDALVQATDGNFYGTTYYGGASHACSGGCGTVFETTAEGKLTTLHSFDGTDGANPYAGLVQATNGNFLGATVNGGVNDAGTIFEITAGGDLTTLSVGGHPYDAPLQASNGNVYGTTSAGGDMGDGTAFRITPSGTLTTLYSFCSKSGCTDGETPYAGLVQATNGDFYGTTYAGGDNGGGTVFKITPSGTLTTLHTFDGSDGAHPYGAPVQDTNGTFYGTTSLGGADNYGAVFSLAVGLAPFVETNPTSGKVGTAVTILGNNLKGATSVTFNGTPATITSDSNTEIKTTVPSGASTGYVKVTTSAGHTLTSNVKFRVP